MPPKGTSKKPPSAGPAGGGGAGSTKTAKARGQRQLSLHELLGGGGKKKAAAAKKAAVEVCADNAVMLLDDNDDSASEPPFVRPPPSGDAASPGFAAQRGERSLAQSPVRGRKGKAQQQQPDVTEVQHIEIATPTAAAKPSSLTVSARPVREGVVVTAENCSKMFQINYAARREKQKAAELQQQQLLLPVNDAAAGDAPAGCATPPRGTGGIGFAGFGGAGGSGSATASDFSALRCLTAYRRESAVRRQGQGEDVAATATTTTPAEAADPAHAAAAAHAVDLSLALMKRGEGSRQYKGRRVVVPAPPAEDMNLPQTPERGQAATRDIGISLSVSDARERLLRVATDDASTATQPVDEVRPAVAASSTDTLSTRSASGVAQQLLFSMSTLSDVSMLDEGSNSGATAGSGEQPQQQQQRRRRRGAAATAPPPQRAADEGGRGVCWATAVARVARHCARAGDVIERLIDTAQEAAENYSLTAHANARAAMVTLAQRVYATYLLRRLGVTPRNYKHLEASDTTPTTSLRHAARAPHLWTALYAPATASEATVPSAIFATHPPAATLRSYLVDWRKRLLAGGRDQRMTESISMLTLTTVTLGAAVVALALSNVLRGARDLQRVGRRYLTFKKKKCRRRGRTSTKPVDIEAVQKKKEATALAHATASYAMTDDEDTAASASARGTSDSDATSTDGSTESEEEIEAGLVVRGPAGVGKTAAIYAAAQEAGFHVLEIACNRKRTRDALLLEVKDATRYRFIAGSFAGGDGAAGQASGGGAANGSGTPSITDRHRLTASINNSLFSNNGAAGTSADKAGGIKRGRDANGSATVAANGGEEMEKPAKRGRGRPSKQALAAAEAEALARQGKKTGLQMWLAGEKKEKKSSAKRDAAAGNVEEEGDGTQQSGAATATTPTRSTGIKTPRADDDFSPTSEAKKRKTLGGAAGASQRQATLGAFFGKKNAGGGAPAKGATEAAGAKPLAVTPAKEAKGTNRDADNVVVVSPATPVAVPARTPGTAAQPLPMSTASAPATTASATRGKRSDGPDNILVLFEGADVVFDDEGNFHAGVRDLLSDARCPVILTCNTMTPALRALRVPELRFDSTCVRPHLLAAMLPPVPLNPDSTDWPGVAPSMHASTSLGLGYAMSLQLILLAEGYVLSVPQLKSLLLTFGCDLRAAVNACQLWLQGHPGSHAVLNSVVADTTPQPPTTPNNALIEAACAAVPSTGCDAVADFLEGYGDRGGRDLLRGSTPLSNAPYMCVGEMVFYNYLRFVKVWDTSPTTMSSLPPTSATSQRADTMSLDNVAVDDGNSVDPPPAPWAFAYDAAATEARIYTETLQAWARDATDAGALAALAALQLQVDACHDGVGDVDIGEASSGEEGDHAATEAAAKGKPRVQTSTHTPKRGRDGPAKNNTPTPQAKVTSLGRLARARGFIGMPSPASENTSEYGPAAAAGAGLGSATPQQAARLFTESQASDAAAASLPATPALPLRQRDDDAAAGASAETPLVYPRAAGDDDADADDETLPRAPRNATDAWVAFFKRSGGRFPGDRSLSAEGGEGGAATPAASASATLRAQGEVEMYQQAQTLEGMARVCRHASYTDVWKVSLLKGEVREAFARTALGVGGAAASAMSSATASDEKLGAEEGDVIDHGALYTRPVAMAEWLPRALSATTLRAFVPPRHRRAVADLIRSNTMAEDEMAYIARVVHTAVLAQPHTSTNVGNRLRAYKHLMFSSAAHGRVRELPHRLHAIATPRALHEYLAYLVSMWKLISRTEGTKLKILRRFTDTLDSAEWLAIEQVPSKIDAFRSVTRNMRPLRTRGSQAQ